MQQMRQHEDKESSKRRTRRRRRRSCVSHDDCNLVPLWRQPRQHAKWLHCLEQRDWQGTEDLSLWNPDIVAAAGNVVVPKIVSALAPEGVGERHWQLCCGRGGGRRQLMLPLVMRLCEDENDERLMRNS
jgi:hypothetical protein